MNRLNNAVAQRNAAREEALMLEAKLKQLQVCGESPGRFWAGGTLHGRHGVQWGQCICAAFPLHQQPPLYLPLCRTTCSQGGWHLWQLAAWRERQQQPQQPQPAWSRLRLQQRLLPAMRA